MAARGRGVLLPRAARTGLAGPGGGGKGGERSGRKRPGRSLPAWAPVPLTPGSESPLPPLPPSVRQARGGGVRCGGPGAEEVRAGASPGGVRWGPGWARLGKPGFGRGWVGRREGKRGWEGECACARWGGVSGRAAGECACVRQASRFGPVRVRLDAGAHVHARDQRARGLVGPGPPS